MTEKQWTWGWRDLVLVLIGAIPLVLGWAWYDELPEQVASHFGMDGTPNGWMSKNGLLMLIGGFCIVLPLLMNLLRRIDPNRENYRKFQSAFELIRFATTGLLSGVFIMALAYNKGYDVNIQMYVLLGIGVLYLIFGNVMTQIRYNYFIGIRTPWTLASEDVWRRTHRVAGPLMMGAGAVSLIAAFLPGAIAIWVFLAAVAVSVGVPFVYSYVLFSKGVRS